LRETTDWSDVVALTAEIVVVALVIAAALVLFATEIVPVDVTALSVLVALLVISEGSQYLATVGLIGNAVVLVTPQEGISGFASSATITVLAMFILSDGVQRTGVVQRLGRVVSRYTGDSEGRQLLAPAGAMLGAYLLLAAVLAGTLLATGLAFGRAAGSRPGGVGGAA
jgi:di/tricarboxylate transporter